MTSKYIWYWTPGSTMEKCSPGIPLCSMATEPGTQRLPIWSLLGGTEATELLMRLGAGDDNEPAIWVAAEMFLSRNTLAGYFLKQAIWSEKRQLVSNWPKQ